jgi:hypothetical protein
MTAGLGPWGKVQGKSRDLTFVRGEMRPDTMLVGKSLLTESRFSVLRVMCDGLSLPAFPSPPNKLHQNVSPRSCHDRLGAATDADSNNQ